MKTRNIAVLLTCHNRKAKTIACLSSLFQASIPSEYLLDIYLTNDGSTDGTGDSIKVLFPQVRVIEGDGSLFWAGGMRLAWKTAIQKKSYDAYLLINDDVVLYPDFFQYLLATETYSLEEIGKTGIYSSATINEEDDKITYGGSRIKDNKLLVRIQMIEPKEQPQRCDITNANILWVSKEVVNEIGIFDNRFTHGTADYDYSLQANKKGFPVFLAPKVGGVCADDHGKNWRDTRYSLKERIAYLKSPKGLAYDEYLYYIRKHFPMFLPYSFVMLWTKTFFPFIWNRFKN
ncbi:glycosyltransferase family 2 protein [Proteiniphilum sp.]|uniref:glycosyltransferase family 2 protein n=1 Tax=Proteiniphilum sp. TaxID=1926877 RepID=UPI00331CD298